MSRAPQNQKGCFLVLIYHRTFLYMISKVDFVIASYKALESVAQFRVLSMPGDVPAPQPAYTAKTVLRKA